MKPLFFAFLAVAIISCASVYNTSSAGKPWQGTPQQIPGKIECEYYNQGGQGIAYNDSDAVNNGSGKLNPVNGTYLNEFRMSEGVDISYTKMGDIDNNPYNKVHRDLGKLYVGWTKPGEWINYTVQVNKSGNYTVGVLYTSNGDGAISLDIDGKDVSGPLTIESTHNDLDTIKWRQWHHWNKTDSLGTLTLKKGIHVLKLHIVKNGNMNLDYLEFKKQGE